MIEMTDEELNEWIAKKVMGWIWKEKTTDQGTPLFVWVDVNDKFQEGCFFPCQDLNHAYLMEERILNGSQSSKFYYALTKVILNEELDTDELYLSAAKDLIHATARQRCEAAYLTFNLSK